MLLDKVTKPVKELRALAKEIDESSSGQLVAFVAGAVVVGWLGGGIFWIPAAMSGALLLYRLAWAAAEGLNPEKRLVRRLETMRAYLEKLEESGLSQDQQARLAAPMELQIDAQTERLRKNLARLDRLPSRDVEEAKGRGSASAARMTRHPQPPRRRNPNHAPPRPAPRRPSERPVARRPRA